MKLFAIMICACLVFLLPGAGCKSKEQPEPPKQKSKVVKAINKPLPQKVETSVTLAGQPSLAAEQKSETKEEVKTTAIVEKAIKPPATKPAEKEPVVKEEPGYYMVKKGDNLSRIAGRAEVYGNPLKWPILYRLNLNSFEKKPEEAELPFKELSEGTKLKFVTAKESEENVKNTPGSPWVVNVVSATAKDKEKINQAAVKLVKDGYPVYITTAKVKGTDWMRLRVGFFKKKREADDIGKKIMALLNSGELWSTKADEQEKKEFGGY